MDSSPQRSCTSFIGLRDELGLLKIECDRHLDDKHFNYLQGSLNTLIRVLHRIDTTTLAAVEREFRTNPQIREQIEARNKVLDDCNIPQVREIRYRSLQVAAKAFAVNGGGWAIYLLPLLLPFVGYSKIKKAIKASLSLSELDLNKVAPFSQHQTTSYPALHRGNSRRARRGRQGTDWCRGQNAPWCSHSRRI